MEKEQKQELGRGICITHSCIPLYTVYMQHIMAHSGGMQEWVIQIPSIPILVSVLFPSLHLKYFRIKFLLSFYAHAHETTPTSGYKLSHTHIVVGPEVKCWLCLLWSVPFLPSVEPPLSRNTRRTLNLFALQITHNNKKSH